MLFGGLFVRGWFGRLQPGTGEFIGRKKAELPRSRRCHRPQEGKHLGRPIKVTPELRKKILEKREIGIPAARIARDLNISRASVFRVFKEES